MQHLRLLPKPRVACELEKRGVSTIESSQPVRVRCVAGRLWITLHGEPIDAVLVAGDTFVVDPSNPCVVVHALADARFDVVALGEPAPAATRLGHWLRRLLRRREPARSPAVVLRQPRPSLFVA